MASYGRSAWSFCGLQFTLFGKHFAVLNGAFELKPGMPEVA